ncbi:MAG: hypothetical protein LUO93_03785, partial [Methanomicrobiales archaeon]|nr:hypothetical protein [Methanomicrobiales archaeon]
FFSAISTFLIHTYYIDLPLTAEIITRTEVSPIYIGMTISLLWGRHHPGHFKKHLGNYRWGSGCRRTDPPLPWSWVSCLSWIRRGRIAPWFWF